MCHFNAKKFPSGHSAQSCQDTVDKKTKRNKYHHVCKLKRKCSIRKRNILSIINVLEYIPVCFGNTLQYRVPYGER